MQARRGLEGAIEEAGWRLTEARRALPRMGRRRRVAEAWVPKLSLVLELAHL